MKMHVQKNNRVQDQNLIKMICKKYNYDCDKSRLDLLELGIKKFTQNHDEDEYKKNNKRYLTFKEFDPIKDSINTSTPDALHNYQPGSDPHDLIQKIAYSKDISFSETLELLVRMGSGSIN